LVADPAETNVRNFGVPVRKLQMAAGDTPPSAIPGITKLYCKSIILSVMHNN
jgi:hypothetical protein